MTASDFEKSYEEFLSGTNWSKSERSLFFFIRDMANKFPSQKTLTRVEEDLNEGADIRSVAENLFYIGRSRGYL